LHASAGEGGVVKRRAAWLLVCALGTAVSAMALRDEPARIVSTRFAQHERYDRLVIELDRPAPVVRRPETRWDDLILDISALPSESHQEIATGSPRAGTLALSATPMGTRLSGARRERKLRLFQLQDPPRLIVDFADASGTTLSAPTASAAVPVQPAPRSFAAEAAVELVSAGDRAMNADAAVAAGLPLEPEEQLRLVSHTTTARPSLGKRLLYGVPLALLFGALAALASRVTLDAWTRLRTAPGRSARWTTPLAERLSRAMPLGDAAERRHDDDVHARLELERRLGDLQQEVERLRAGLSRLTRGSEGPV
jgi:hypothetical protein